MSGTVQHTLDDEPAGPKPHLTQRFPGDNEHNVTSIQDDQHEFYCELCYNRVTVSPNRDVEYGHAKDCTHSVWDGEQDD